MKKKDFLEKILEFGAFAAFTSLLLNVTAQIVTRNLMPSVTLAWTEEASRFLFIYTIMFSAPLAMKKKEYVNVDILLTYMPEKFKKTADLVLQFINIGLFVLVAIQGMKFAKIGMGQTSSALRIPMVYMYSAIPIMTFLIALYGTYNMVRHIRGIEDGGEA